MKRGGSGELRGSHQVPLDPRSGPGRMSRLKENGRGAIVAPTGRSPPDGGVRGPQSALAEATRGKGLARTAGSTVSLASRRCAGSASRKAGAAYGGCLAAGAGPSIGEVAQEAALARQPRSAQGVEPSASPCLSPRSLPC